ncbi:hypothetical protein TWF694_011543 [Orbilia ellipsospora]|uniref:Uncharacterized protein n=1 Tax=Orbilia ellipsospora TaxID=2528407 RepID=A0AAV9X6W9_9PEZI
MIYHSSLLLLSVILPHSTLSIHWTRCTPSPSDLLLQQQTSPSSTPLTQNYNALITLLSRKPFLHRLRTSFTVPELKPDYHEINRYESGLGLETPYPIYALRTLFKFITENKLHCHFTDLSFARALSAIEQVDSTSWNTINPLQDSNDDNDNDEREDSTELGYLDTAEDMTDVTMPNTFQYFSFTTARQLSNYVLNYHDELEQFRLDLLSTKQWESTPEFVLDLMGKGHHWREVYEWLEEYIKGLKAFRGDLEVLRGRKVGEGDIVRLSAGKGVVKSWGRELVKCFGRLCPQEFDFTAP